MPIAYSYMRFSSGKQAKGHSIERQQQMAEHYIRDNPHLNLELDTTLNLTDRAISAFSGKNMTDGNLGKFFDLVYNGEIESGSYLLIENLDRFSRDVAWKAVHDLTTLVKSGVVVVCLSDDKVYSDETLSAEGGSFRLMESVIGFMRANDESEQKSRRVKSAWANKFTKIKDGVQLTARVPFWINKADKSKTHADKVAIVKQIFALSAQGYGAIRIAQELNAVRTPTPSSRSKQWALSSVKKVLASEAVLGALVTADGQRHEGYYPAIINSKLWLKTRFIGQSSSSARSTTEVHPLSGLMFCKHCGATAQRSGKTGRIRKDGTKNYWKTLVCAKAFINPRDASGKPLNRKACEYRSISYDLILGHVKAALIRMEEYTPKDEVGKKIRQLKDRAYQIEDLMNMMTEPYEGARLKGSPASRAQMAKLLLELDEVQDEIKQLEQVRRPTSQRLFEGARKAILEGEVTNALMRQCIKRCEIDFKKATLDVYGHDGSSVIGLAMKEPEELQKEESIRSAIAGRRKG